MERNIQNKKADNISKLKKEMPDVYNKLLQIRNILNSIVDEKVLGMNSNIKQNDSKQNNVKALHGNQVQQVHGGVHKAHKPAQLHMQHQKKSVQNTQGETRELRNRQIPTQAYFQNASEIERRKQNVQELINNMLNEIRKRQAVTAVNKNVQIRSARIEQKPIQGSGVQVRQYNMQKKPNVNIKMQMHGNQTKKHIHNNQNNTQRTQKNNNQPQKHEIKQVNTAQVKPVNNRGLKNRTDLNKYL